MKNIGQIAGKLDEAITAVCPIKGVSVGAGEPKEKWTIFFKDEATDKQRADALAVLEAFDVAAADVPAVDKRAVALEALLIEQAKRADAPQAVKDYAAKR